MADEVVITGGQRLDEDTLFYPPDKASGLLGSSPADWPKKRIPGSKTDAVAQASITGQPVWDPFKWEEVKRRSQPMVPRIKTPVERSGIAKKGIELPDWFNWKWLVLPLGAFVVYKILSANKDEYYEG